MAKSRLPKEATLPTDPKWVVIEATDGSPSRWPSNTVENPDREGHVNFMQPVGIDDGMAVKWRIVIGQALAEMHGYPDVESKRWVLKDWPYGYHFYDHNKGQLGGKVRHDLYLVGSTNVARFRSPQEFIPHAYWLMTDPSQDRSRCECKYCAGKPQREISDAMGLYQNVGGLPSMARFAELPRREKRRRILRVTESRVFASVHQTLNPVKLPKGPKQHSNPEREKDLRALLAPKTLGERRWAREGELVWVKLDYPVSVNDSGVDSEEITFWPGMVEEVNFKAEITPKPSHNGVAGNDLHKPSSSGNDGVDPWTIVHKSIYKINLLVVSKTVVYSGDHILPYQSHAPDRDLLSSVQSIIFDLDGKADEELGEIVLPPSESQSEQSEQTLYKRFQAFDPFPPSKPPFPEIEDRRSYSETAAGAFATAIEIASCLSMYYTPCDAWECKFPASQVLETLSATSSIFALADPSYGTVATQTRFQGLWWGPERIWMGDTVRLKLGRYQFAPEGTGTVKKPSGTGRHASSEARSHAHSSHSTFNGIGPHMNGAAKTPTNGTTLDTNGEVEDTRLLGASSRSIFLRVDGLFVEQVPTDDGQGHQNECRMCGTLYELADDDWEPGGDEFGKPEPPEEIPMSNGTASQDGRSSYASTIPTPLKTLMLNKAETAPAQAVNGSTTNVAPPSSSSLFIPNPELLFEPPAQPDIIMVDGPATQSPSMSANRSSPAYPVPPQPPGLKAGPNDPPNPTLSGPLKSSERAYPTPPPPPSLKFRPILRDGYEVIMPLTTLAGRYYPGLLSNSLLQPRAREAIQNLDAPKSKEIRALEGLVPGVHNAVDAYRFLPKRSQMLQQAENIAWEKLVAYWRRRASQWRAAIVIDGD